LYYIKTYNYNMLIGITSDMKADELELI